MTLLSLAFFEIMQLISYSQNFEDIRLWRAFKDVEKGRYLDIGTYEPNDDSVSRLFYDRGWRGVHVEPTPHYAAAMRVARPDERVIEAAVSSSTVPMTFFEIPNTGLSTGLPEIAQLHEKAGWSYREILVPTITLASLFDFMGPEPVHWLKIDVEGMEADVISSWGEHPARPLALVIEATKPSTQEQTHQAWHAKVTSRGYREVLFDGLSRYFIHKSEAHRGEALALSPNVFDGFQVLRSHFSAARLSAESDQAIASVRSEVEVQATEHAEHLAVVTAAAAAASAELDAALQRAGDLESRLAAQAEAHAAALAEAQAAAADAAAQLEAALRQAGELDRQLAIEVEAHAQALEQANAAAAELKAAQERAGELDARLAQGAEAHARVLAEANAVAAELEAARKRGAELDALLAAEIEAHAQSAALAHAAAEEAAVLDKQRTAESAAHAAALAGASAEAAEIAAKLDIANTRAAGLELRLQEQERLHATALATAEERGASAERALYDANGQLIALQAEHLALGRLAGKLEGKLEAQERDYASHVAALAAKRDETRDRLQRAEFELAKLRELGADLRTQLAVSIARAEAAAAEKKAAYALLDAVREQARHLTDEAADLAASLALVSQQRDLIATQAEELRTDRAALTEALEATKEEVTELRKHAGQLTEQVAGLLANLDAASQQRHELATQAEGFSIDRARLADELEAVRTHAAELGAALRSEIDRLHGAIAVRDRQVADAERLLAGFPDPLEGTRGLRRSLARWLIGAELLSAMAQHRAAALDWQQSKPEPTHSPDFDADATSLDCMRDDPQGRSATVGTSMLTDDGPITSVAQLLVPHDRAFIHAAYQSVLGRAPDPEGEAYYLARLRLGGHKLGILKQMRHSAEGRAFIPAVAGLDRAIRRYRWAMVPLLGIMLRRLWGIDGNGATHRALRVIANDVARIRSELGKLQAETATQAELVALAAAVRELAARPSAPPIAELMQPSAEAPMIEEPCGAEMASQEAVPNDRGLGRNGSRVLGLLASSLRARRALGGN
jgi:FkbM family methyltransferase